MVIVLAVIILCSAVATYFDSIMVPKTVKLITVTILMTFYLVLILVVTKKNPFKFLKAIREPQLLAFSTASSAAVMPLSMKTADEKLGVSSNISDFVIPVGATINMDGTALFQCVS